MLKCNRRGRAMVVGIWLASGVMGANVLHAQNLVQNGGFDTGDLTGWTTFVTSNGNLGSAIGLPDVTMFDVAGTGSASHAAQFMVGEAVYNGATGHTSQGGGIFQTFNSSGGQFFFNANIAAYDYYTAPNADAGLFTLSVDGVTLASDELGGIQPGQVLRGELDGMVSLGAGSHQITIEITRPWVTGTTPLEFVNDIQITPVPEPSAFVLGVLGLSLVLIFQRWVVRR